MFKMKKETEKMRKNKILEASSIIGRGGIYGLKPCSGFVIDEKWLSIEK